MAQLALGTQRVFASVLNKSLELERVVEVVEDLLLIPVALLSNSVDISSQLTTVV